MQELIIFQKAYEFSKWLFNHTNKFPKSHRFSLAVKLENGILDFIRLISIANHRKTKFNLLRAADDELLSLRILIRLSQDMEFFSVSSYEYAAKQLDELVHAKQANTYALRKEVFEKIKFRR